MIICGIDPGLDGGYVELDSTTGAILFQSPLESGLDMMIRRFWDTKALPGHVWIEKAQVMIRGGKLPSSRGSFTYGTGFGELLGIMRATRTRYTLVHPAIWTRVMHLGTRGSVAEKAKSFEACARLFPAETWLLPGRRKPHDGIAEAALIAEYGRRQLGGATPPTDPTF